MSDARRKYAAAVVRFGFSNRKAGELLTGEACHRKIDEDYATLMRTTITSDGRVYDNNSTRYYLMYENLRADRTRFLSDRYVRFARGITHFPDALCDIIARAVPAFLHCECAFCVETRGSVVESYRYVCVPEDPPSPFVPPLALYVALRLREILTDPTLFVQADDPRVVRSKLATPRPTRPPGTIPDFTPAFPSHPPFTCLLFEYYQRMHAIPRLRAATNDDRVYFWKMFGTQERMSYRQYMDKDISHITLPDALARRVRELPAHEDAMNVPIPDGRLAHYAADEDESDSI
jgi:hypothetical protein